MTENTTVPNAEALPQPIARLRDAGVAVWLDDLSRELLSTGELARLVRERAVVGVTSNPTIFAAAIGDGHGYDEQLGELAAAGSGVDDAALALMTQDVQAACDLFTGLHASSGGMDGRVSLEVAPGLAKDTAGTVAMAKQLWRTVDRPNLYIKIPATREGLPAIADATAEGINVNVTLIFSLDRYRGVIDAYLDGLERARAAGRDLSRIDSVASFFVSRVDSAVDKRLDSLGTPEAAKLRGTVAIANARLAYQVYEESLDTDRWRELAAAGAHPQRPLWASTGVKDPAYSDTRYVDELVARDVVNTMPGKTLEAVADHAEITGDTVTGTYAEAAALLVALDGVGIDLAEVTAELEDEGVEKFVVSWNELIASVASGLDAAGTAR